MADDNATLIRFHFQTSCLFSFGSEIANNANFDEYSYLLLFILNFGTIIIGYAKHVHW